MITNIIATVVGLSAENKKVHPSSTLDQVAAVEQSAPQFKLWVYNPLGVYGGNKVSCEYSSLKLKDIYREISVLKSNYFES